MARLLISLLGPFQARLDRQTIPGFAPAAARALLAYLAVEAGQEHTRRELAGLLWPEQPDSVSLSNLRYTLSDLRKAFGDRLEAPLTSVLAVTRETIRLTPDPNCWFDVCEFERLLRAPDSPGGDAAECEHLEEAVRLFRGPFLEGFALPGSPAFEDWLFWTREQFQRRVIEVLRRLVTHDEASGRYEAAQAAARRQVQMEPLDEGAHRQLMHALAMGGQRSAALAQYENCRRILAQEMGVDPMSQTVALYEAIRGGTLAGPVTAPARPSPPVPGAEVQPRGRGNGPLPPEAPAPAPVPTFVAREQELAQLDRDLAQALAGQGRVAFVIGEAGSGKTALMQEFVRRALAARADIVAASGGCNAATGLGDPYLPFREILQMLAGDIEARRASGAISPELARRLWSLFPCTIRALVEQGPDLVDVFVPAADLLLRAEDVLLGHRDGPFWRARLAGLALHKAESEKTFLPQTNVCEQVTRVLQEIARYHPLVLVLDDLQWVDDASASLLFHLGRHLAGSPILILGAYRSPDVDLGRDGARHPLAVVTNELQRDFGEIRVDLARAEGRAFLEALLDSQPNLLDGAFRDALYRRTGGQALFTVELLHGLQARGNLVRDAGGRWISGPELDWAQLPARVEAAIAERISRLPGELQQLLAVASVEGEKFTAEAVARAQGVPEAGVIHALSGPLGQGHRLVTALSVRRAEGQRLSTYRFRHSLFQQYLYGRLDPVERVRLHEAIGLALEAHHGAAASELAVELARHFERAGLVDKAAAYSLRAGHQAMEMLAHREAVQHYRRGLALLPSLPDSAGRDRQELDLQLALGSALLATEGMGSQGQILAYTRAYALSQRLGERVELWPALQALASSSTSRGEYPKALALGQQLLDLAEHSADPAVLALAHFTLGATLFSSGISLVRSRAHLEQAILYYEDVPNTETRRYLTSLNVFDVGVNARAWLSAVLWILGYPDEALRRSQEAVAAAQQLDHLLSEVVALYAAGHAHKNRGEYQALWADVALLERLVAGKNLLVGDVWVDVFSGWLMVHEGKVDEGLARLRRGTAAWEKTGAVFGTTAQHILLAEACLGAGQFEEGAAVVARALAFVARTNARPNEAALHRLEGEGLQARGDGAALAEASFRRAMEIARAGEQKSWELQAVLGLCRFWQRQGPAGTGAEKLAEARTELASVYDWFTEGFDTPDLRAARALLGSA